MAAPNRCCHIFEGLVLVLSAYRGSQKIFMGKLPESKLLIRSTRLLYWIDLYLIQQACFHVFISRCQYPCGRFTFLEINTCIPGKKCYSVY